MIESRDYVAAFSGEFPSNPRALRARADVLIARAAQSPDDLDALMLAREAVSVASHTAKGRRGGDERHASGFLRRVDAIARKDPATNLVYSAVARLQRAVVDVYGTGLLPDRIVGSICTEGFLGIGSGQEVQGVRLGIRATKEPMIDPDVTLWSSYELLAVDDDGSLSFGRLPTTGSYHELDPARSLTSQLPQLDTVGVRCLPDEQRQLFADVATRLLEDTAIVRV